MKLKESVLTYMEKISSLEEGPEVSIFSTRKNITKSLSYEETLQENEKATTKKCKERYKGGCQVINFKNYYFSGFC